MNRSVLPLIPYQTSVETLCQTKKFQFLLEKAKIHRKYVTYGRKEHDLNCLRNLMSKAINGKTLSDPTIGWKNIGLLKQNSKYHKYLLFFAIILL